MPDLSTSPLGLAQPWGGVDIPHKGSGPESLKEAFLEGGKQDVDWPDICLGVLSFLYSNDPHTIPVLKWEKLLFLHTRTTWRGFTLDIQQLNTNSW